jgi:hypothetical protein
MPEISRFYGITVKMYYGDHAPPHFHAEYGEDELVVQIDPVAELAGYLPRRATGMVLDWAIIHQAELLNAWQMAQTNQPPSKIDPLP